MSCEVFLLFLSVLGACHGCLQDPASAYRFTGTVCRLTYPAAVVLNEKTTKVIEAAFQHARYPSMKGEKSLAFIGRVKYGLDNLEIYNLTIGRSAFELRPGEGIAIEISNVSAVFKGTIQYGYGSWLVNVSNSIDFEIESQIDLGINPKLYCGNGKVAADTSDCYLNFHKLHLHLQGDKEPNWLKKLFTNFITLTVKLVIKGQICKEINKAANILADFIQDTAALPQLSFLDFTHLVLPVFGLTGSYMDYNTANMAMVMSITQGLKNTEQFLSDGDISVDISLAAPPVITANYIESYHKGLTNYKNTTAVIDDSVFHPSHLTENRMLYFWVSDQLFNPMISAAKQDGCFKLNISGEELIRLFQTDLSSVPPQFFTKCLKESASPELRVWCSSGPFLNTSTIGTTVSAAASGELYCDSEGTAMLSFQTSVVVDVTASYADKKLFLHGKPTEVSIMQALLPLQNQYLQKGAEVEFLREAVEKIGIPKVLFVLQTELTRLLDKQGANLFDIYNPEMLPRDGYVVIQMDFGFPHHLLVEFLKRTLQ